jgi:hypothetical protein
MAELIIAIVIFAILAALSYGAYRQYNEALITRSAANQVAADIALARSQAIKRRGNVSIVVDDANLTYVIRDEAGNVYKTRFFDSDSDLPLRVIEIPPPDSITFNSRGFVVGTLIPVVVGRRDREFRVTMNAVGRTQINKHP